MPDEHDRFAPPLAPVADAPAAAPQHDPHTLGRVASGQRFMVFAVIASLVSGAVRSQASSDPFTVMAVSIAALVLAVFGSVRLCGALGHGVPVRVACALAMFVPLVNIAVMIVLSLRATRLLRANGYTVGLLGAKAR